MPNYNKGEDYLKKKSETDEIASKIIAPLLTPLFYNPNDPNQGIYIHNPTQDSLCIRWEAEYSPDMINDPTNSPVNFEVILFRNGRIQFNYGSGNMATHPTVGISKGDGVNYYLAPHHQRQDLHMAPSFMLIPRAQYVRGDEEVLFNTPGFSWNAFIYEGYAYVADETAGVQISISAILKILNGQDQSKPLVQRLM